VQVRIALVAMLAACGGGQHADKPRVDTAGIAAEIDREQSELALILHRDRADCPALAANLRSLFPRLSAALQRAKDAQRDPEIAKQLTTDLRRYDADARQRDAAMEADVTPDAPCIHDAAVRAALMAMPTM
jgi:hypothetical protein